MLDIDYFFTIIKSPQSEVSLCSQRVLPLTTIPFELNFKYFEQRKYMCGEMYWMTFRWHWPKAATVSLIDKKLLAALESGNRSPNHYYNW